MNKKYIWLIIPIISFIFLNELIINNKIPLANDIVAHEPIKQWKSSTSEYPHWFPNLFSGMPSYGGFIITGGHPLQSILNFLFFNLGAKYWFHFSLGGIGMFFLIRYQKFTIYSSLFGGIAYSITPYLFGLINAGHNNKIMACAFIPWLTLSALYLFKNRSIKSVFILSLVSAFQLWTKHPQIFYYTWMLIVLWWIIDILLSSIGKKLNIKSIFTSLALMVLSAILAIIMVSDPYYDIYRFQKESNRGAPSVLDKTGESNKGTNWEYATQWSFHPAETISFILPYYYGLQNFSVTNKNNPEKFMKQAAYWGYMPFTQSTHYVGLLVIIFSIYSLFFSIKNRKIKKEELILWIIAIIFLIIGFGNHFSLIFKPLFYFAPYFSKFRVPSMIYTLFALLLPFLAVFGLEKMINESDKKILFFDCLKVFGYFIAPILFLLAFGESILSFSSSGDARFPQYIDLVKNIRFDLFSKGLMLALFLSGATLTSIWFYSTGKISKHVLSIILISILSFDLWIINNEFLSLKPSKSMADQFQNTPEILFMKKDSSQFRIFPADDIGSNRYGYWNIESIGGYRAVKLRNYQDLMDAGGFRRPQVLNMLNVKYLITRKRVRNTSFKQLSKIKNLYENLDVLPRAWFVGSLQSVNDQKSSLSKVMDISFRPKDTAVIINYDGPQLSGTSNGKVEISSFSPNNITIQCNTNSGALLVLSEIYYKPGWRCKIDGQVTPIYQTNHVLRSVYVSDGSHDVEFYYDSSDWKLAKVVSRFSFFTVLIFLGLIFFREKINKI